MMKRIISILMLLMIVFILPANTIHTIIFADTNDQSIGQSVRVDVKKFQNWANMVADALKTDGYSQKVYNYSGNLCSKSNLLDVVNNLYCTDDIVLFYYSGHGSRSINDVSKFPRMCLGANSTDQFLSVSQLNTLLQQKNPRLLIIIADCCNSYFDGSIPMGRMVAMGSTAGRVSYPTSKIRELFTKRRGNIISAGATKGEYGWSGNFTGGLFTNSFIESFDFSIERGETASWNVIFKDTKDLTFELSQIAYLDRIITKTQTPVYEININENALPQKKLQRLDIGNGYYLGQVINGKKEGIGAYFFNNGGKFEGEFKNNTINGSGIYFWTNGRYFAGTWVNGKRTGYGIEVHENGTYTTQYWENEVLTQAPRPINPQRYNTSTGYYIGDLKDGKPHGRGTFYWDNGGSFEGTWVNNVIQGSGILRFANNGGVYVGCWKDGKRQFCYGLQCLSNGQKLIGYWENEVYRAKSIIIDNQ